jgi:hypothetical protein
LKWSDLQIEIDDDSILIEAGHYNKKLDFNQLGFSMRDQRLGTLKFLAEKRGLLDRARILGKESGTTPIKNRIHDLRQHLQEVFGIDGDPIHYDSRKRIYICQFTVRRTDDSFFPTPAGATWTNFEFVELKDGRIRVTAAGDKTPQPLRTSEPSAARMDSVTLFLTLDRMHLRDKKGRLSPDGTLLIELLRARGKLKRPGGDLSMLSLNSWLKKWAGLPR